MKRTVGAISAILMLMALAGCANQPASPTSTVSAAHPAPAVAPPPPPVASNPPDIFNILVDGKMYNHMDDARRALNDETTRIVAQIPAAATSRLGTLVVIAPPVHVPALNYPNASPAYQQKFKDFMAFLDSHKYELNVAALRKSNNFATVTLDRSATPGAVSGSDFKVWQQRDGQATSWWIEGHGKAATRLQADLDHISLENSQAIVAEISSRAEHDTGR